MKIELKPGKYIVAVSGGVDSVVLLNVLSNTDDMDLIVAHFDHGIRNESRQDAIFVANQAKKYVLPFVTKSEKLGPNTSESKARERRYAFLESVMNEYSADAIVTAHHQDDAIETAIINLLRGTNRKGLTSLDSSFRIKRPMLDTTKDEILDYAKQKSLKWREDETNQDDKYLRNSVRKKLKKMPESEKLKLIDIINSTHKNNSQIDKILDSLVPENDMWLTRTELTRLPYDVSCELVAKLLRKHHTEMSQKRIHQLVHQLKTTHKFSSLDIDKNWILVVEQDQIRMQPRC